MLIRLRSSRDKDKSSRQTIYLDRQYSIPDEVLNSVLILLTISIKVFLDFGSTKYCKLDRLKLC